MKVKNVEVFETRDYGIFNRLVGNREVTNKRVAIIKDSIETIGYVSNPIIVNEKLEVIDGQGRAEALKQLDLPVEYRVIKGIGIEECRAMNLKPTSWTIEDFVKSYAEYGNENYIRLKQLADKFKFGLTSISCVCTNTVGQGENIQKTLREGTFVLSEEDFMKVYDVCVFMTGFTDIQKKIGGRKDAFFRAVSWIAMQPGVDRNRLSVAIHQQHGTLTPFAKCEVSLHELSEIYNKGYSKQNRRYFDYEWKTKRSETVGDEE